MVHEEGRPLESQTGKEEEKVKEIKKQVSVFSTELTKLCSVPQMKDGIQAAMQDGWRMSEGDPEGTVTLKIDEGVLTAEAKTKDVDESWRFTQDDLVDDTGELHLLPLIHGYNAADYQMSVVESQPYGTNMTDLAVVESLVSLGDAFSKLGNEDETIKENADSRKVKMQRMKNLLAMRKDITAKEGEIQGLKNELTTSRTANGNLIEQVKAGEQPTQTVSQEAARDIVHGLLEKLASGKLDGGDQTRLIGELSKLGAGFGMQELGTILKIAGNKGEDTQTPNSHVLPTAA
jgi:hypothetical protein